MEGRRWAVAALALVVLISSGCSSWGRRTEAAPLSREDFDQVYLRSALKELIHDVFTEGDPGALNRFFPPKLRGRVDTEAMYRRLVGAPPGVYQPRFWDAGGVEVSIDETGTRAGTRVRIEFLDTRPGSGGAGRYITINLTWSKQGGTWYLAPLPDTARPGNAT